MRRRYSARRSARRARWTYADTTVLAVVDGPAPTYASAPMLPVARIRWLLENERRSSMTLAGILLWIRYNWRTPDTGSGTFYLPDVDFYIGTDMQGGTGLGATPRLGIPFTPPALPSAVTSWDNVADPDGLDPYLWVHHQWGRLDRSTQGTQNECPPQHGNTTQLVTWGGGQEYTDGPTRVAAMWQPDVHVKTRRRLVNDSEVFIGMRTGGTNTGMTVSMQACWRLLTK